MGIGVLELIAILVVALVVLGPAKTVDMAKSAGKMLGEIRRAMSDLSKAVNDEEEALERDIGLGRDLDLDKTGTPEERP